MCIVILILHLLYYLLCYVLLWKCVKKLKRNEEIFFSLKTNAIFWKTNLARNFCEKWASSCWDPWNLFLKLWEFGWEILTLEEKFVNFFCFEKFLKKFILKKWRKILGKKNFLPFCIWAFEKSNMTAKLSFWIFQNKNRNFFFIDFFLKKNSSKYENFKDLIFKIFDRKLIHFDYSFSNWLNKAKSSHSKI